MENRFLKPRMALNKAFLKLKPSRADIDNFKSNLLGLLDNLNSNKFEEFNKNLISIFLRDAYYQQNYHVNTKDYIDLVIYNGKDPQSNVAVIFETKRPTNTNEMISIDSLNKKALQEIVYYYLRERFIYNNLEVKNLIITNVYEWFIFDAIEFEKHFAQNKELVQKFLDFENERLSGVNTDFFYTNIASPAISQICSEIEFTYFDLRNYEKLIRNRNKNDDNELIPIFKILSPEHLLKLPFMNDSNTLDKGFYSELLHIVGLTETKDGSKKFIERKIETERDSGSILEETINQLDTLEKVARLKNSIQYGETSQEKLFNIALELSITWLNRILFLKLLEAQLINYNKDAQTYSFLNLKKIKSYDDLNSLFFQVLAKKTYERHQDVKSIFENVPYLNSSLFQPTALEHSTLFISNLNVNVAIPIYSQTVLKDTNGKKITGKLNTLEYLFRFLDAYDFSSEGSEEIQEENKTLINASVLGLIFEKINGYKDGSYFTPGFITMYMCRETIQKAVINKFNEAAAKLNTTYPLSFDSLTNIYNNIGDGRAFSISEANKIINSIKICDPAVGSGHFLVSALNELIYIKSDLGILTDSAGRVLRGYHIEVVNDELIITDIEGGLFEYKPKNKESQRVQETLFHEKQTLIENCLFGVDINANSVKICRLRLWIELLKNAYYKTEKELETLPNIDINIKRGNSLVSRFPIDTDLRTALKKSKRTIESYRLAVATYRNAENREQKWEMESLIDSIKSEFSSEMSLNDPKIKRLQKLQAEYYQLTTEEQFFDISPKKKNEWEKKVVKLNEEIINTENEIEAIKKNRIYDNAFEWRFEFPEVLDDDGNFIGFDVVIGNPPYIGIRTSLIPKYHSNYYKQNFILAKGQYDIFVLFIERSSHILAKNGFFSYIVSKRVTTNENFEIVRKFIMNELGLYSYVDSKMPFESVNVESSIILCDLSNSKQNISVKSINNKSLTMKFEIEKEFLNDLPFTIFPFLIDYNTIKLVKEIYRRNNLISLGQIAKITRGFEFGFNHPSIVNIPNNMKIIKGEHILRYAIIESGYFLNIDINDKKTFKNQEIFTQTPKLLTRFVSNKLMFAIDEVGYYNTNVVYNILIIDISYDIKYLLGLLNSSLINFWFFNMYSNVDKIFPHIQKNQLECIPIRVATKEKQNEIIKIVDEVLLKKQFDKYADTKALETQIDQIVYKLYNLTLDEIKIVESN